jgi:hypothetical protein
MLNHNAEHKESPDGDPFPPEYSEWLEPGTKMTVSPSQASSLPRTETQMKGQAIDGH